MNVYKSSQRFFFWILETEYTVENRLTPETFADT